MLQLFHYLQVSLPSIYDSANFTSIEEENASEGIESCKYMTVSSSNVSEHVSSPRSSLHLSECSLSMAMHDEEHSLLSTYEYDAIKPAAVCPCFMSRTSYFTKSFQYGDRKKLKCYFKVHYPLLKHNFMLYYAKWIRSRRSTRE